jgi:SAM-dependent methyltransferase
MLKKGTEVRTKKGISYIVSNGKIISYTPWLGDLFSFLYDSIMKKSVFPKKFEASLDTHNQFLINELKELRNKNILELATGSGNLSDFLSNDIKYSGIDISNGLLKIAHKRFRRKNFNDLRLYLCSADNIPFEDNSFDICICNLSLNFFNDVKTVINEIKRVLKNNGTFICSVPVPERNKKKSTIRGKLFTEKELKGIFENTGFEFHSNNLINGTLLYFKAIKK